MPTVNNATGVYATLGYNFDDPNKDITNFSANSQAHLSTMPAFISAWQAQDIINDDVGGYFQNPTSEYVNTIINTANSFVTLYQSSNGISGLETLYASANSLVSTAKSFLSHTDRLSGVTPWDGDNTVPYYQSALNYGKTAVYITNQTDGIINTSPVLGSFTSILVVPQIQANANTILSSNTIIFNSIGSGLDANSNTVFTSNLSSSQISQIISNYSNTNILLSGRQNADVTYFTNLKDFVSKFNTVKQFSNLGETGEELITKFIGTEKLKTNLTIDYLSNVPYTPGANTSGESNTSSGGAITENISDVINSILAQSSAAYVKSNNTSALANTFSDRIDASYNQANTGTSIAQSAYSQANTGYSTAQLAYTQANTGTTLAQAAFNKANSANTLAQTAYNQSNTNFIFVQGVDNTQNTNISNSITLAQAAFNYANTIGSGGVSTIDTVARNSITVIQGVDSTQNTNISNLTSYAQASYAQSNTNTSSINSLNTYATSSYAQANTATTTAVNATFPSGTKLAFAQASAPTGWTQDVSDNSDNRMFRVVKTAGGGVGGSHSPILNNVVPSHTHGMTTGTESVDHSHSGTTGTVSSDHAHVFGGDDQVASQGGFGVDSYFSYDAVSNTSGGGVRMYTYGITANHTHGFSTGGRSAAHTHSGTTDNGSSQTNWTPRYIDMIVCAKN